jgi:hypothetical protein
VRGKEAHVAFDEPQRKERAEPSQLRAAGSVGAGLGTPVQRPHDLELHARHCRRNEVRLAVRPRLQRAALGHELA